MAFRGMGNAFYATRAPSNGPLSAGPIHDVSTARCARPNNGRPVAEQYRSA